MESGSLGDGAIGTRLCEMNFFLCWSGGFGLCGITGMNVWVLRVLAGWSAGWFVGAIGRVGGLPCWVWWRISYFLFSGLSRLRKKNFFVFSEYYVS